MNEVKPRQSSLFAQRKSRVETIGESLQIFVDQILSKETEASIKEMLKCHSENQNAEVTITVKIRGDAKSSDTATASIETRLSTRFGSQVFYGLS